MIYEIWDTDTFNLVGSYESEAAALRVVQDAVDRYGAQYVDGLALVQEDERGASLTLAEGQALLRRAVTMMAAAEIADR